MKLTHTTLFLVMVIEIILIIIVLIVFVKMLWKLKQQPTLFNEVDEELEKELKDNSEL